MNSTYVVACIALATSLISPVRADDFLNQLSRTDGNVSGEQIQAPHTEAANPAPEMVAFMHELARTDGDVGGESRPEADGGSGQPSREHVAFLQELARSDGNVAVEPIEATSGIAIASR
jgi:hypothetical protein